MPACSACQYERALRATCPGMRVTDRDFRSLYLPNQFAGHLLGALLVRAEGLYQANGHDQEADEPGKLDSCAPAQKLLDLLVGFRGDRAASDLADVLRLDELLGGQVLVAALAQRADRLDPHTDGDRVEHVGVVDAPGPEFFGQDHVHPLAVGMGVRAGKLAACPEEGAQVTDQ